MSETQDRLLRLSDLTDGSIGGSYIYTAGTDETLFTLDKDVSASISKQSFDIFTFQAPQDGVYTITATVKNGDSSYERTLYLGVSGINSVVNTSSFTFGSATIKKSSSGVITGEVYIPRGMKVKIYVSLGSSTLSNAITITAYAGATVQATRVYN